MAFVVTRRFRGGESGAPASSRSYKQEKDAREAARVWVEEGWEVSLLSTASREQRTMRLDPVPPMPRNS